MDPITVAVVAALTTLGNASLGEAAKKATADAYEALKQGIKRKFGNDHAAPKLIETIEKLPSPVEGACALDQQIAAFKLASDPEILEAAKRVSAVVNQTVGGVNVTAETIYGSIGDNNTNTFSFGDAEKRSGR